ncbi:MAG: hypothetical protein AB1641_22725 [Thermodesulfobacteriota bacterium]
MKRTLTVVMAFILVVGVYLPQLRAADVNVQIGTTPAPGGSPPPQAPAHGVRAKRMYNFYPSANVYFEPIRGLWFYLEAGAWKFGVSLPTSFKLKLGDAVSLELDTDKPYTFNQEHLKKYPPGQAKKMGGAGDLIPDQGKGKGKGKGQGK